MDFRKDYSKPGQPPFQPTVAKYTDNYILFISSSKAFSYAGQRIGMMVISDKLFNRKFPDLLRFYNTDTFGKAMVYGIIQLINFAHGEIYAAGGYMGNKPILVL